MSSKELYSKEWCDLIFQGRNKAYGAYRLRERAGKRYRWAMLCVVGMAALAVLFTVGGHFVMRYLLQRDLEEAAKELERMKPKDLRDGYEVKFQATARLRFTTRQKPGVAASVPKITEDANPFANIKQEIGYTGQLDYDPNFETVIAPIIDTTAQLNEKLPEVQERVVPTEEVKNMPVFPGGPKALMQWLDQRVVYPKRCIDAGVEGDLQLTFIVDETGRVVDPQILHSFNPDIDRAVLLAARRMPLWQPGRDAKGRNAKVMITIPMSFHK